MVCFCVCIADGLIVRYDLSGRSGFVKGISCLTQASYNVFRARNRSALVYASNRRTARFLRKRKKSRAPKQPGLFLSILSVPFHSCRNQRRWRTTSKLIAATALVPFNALRTGRA